MHGWMVQDGATFIKGATVSHRHSTEKIVHRDVGCDLILAYSRVRGVT